MIHNHPSGVLDPSDADLQVAARLFELGLGTAITDNQARELYGVVGPPEPRVRELLDVEELQGSLARGGQLSRMLPGFEDRPGQRRMLRLAADRYNEGGMAVVEAGTGTGKSLAYLLPAASWALRNNERTLVSTNTINLQEQLVSKDLPLVQRLLGEGLSWSLVKGRGNYVSIRRARLAWESAASLFEEDRSEEIRGLLEWIEETEDGSLADLASPPSEVVWEEVRSDGDICMRARCPFFQACFYQRARREASAAKILVVNHHLLFTDLSVRLATQNFGQSAVLPPYAHLILDEAHNVEDAATTHMGVEVSRRGLFRLLSRLDRRGKGILTAIQSEVGRQAPPEAARELSLRIKNRVRPALEDARDRLGLLFDVLEPLAAEEESEAIRLGAEDLPEPLENVEISEQLRGVLGALALLEREVFELRSRCAIILGEDDPTEGRLLDLQSVQRRLAGAGAALRLVLDPEEGEGSYVRWMERRRVAGRQRGAGARNLTLAAAPIELGPILREGLFERMEDAVLTSATLTTRDRFDFIRRRLGLGIARSPGGRAEEAGAEADEEALDVREESVPSPFDFGTQTLLCVPTDLPEVRGAGEVFYESTAEIISAMAELTGGGLFVLFTAHRSLRRVAAVLRDRGEDRRRPLFVHGEAPRARLLHGFVDSGQGILLGTASFWEGVDVPGRPLRGLILEKIPFRVPTEPITQARLEAVEAAGGRPFWDYMLPLAALRLKQGFGRLIRSREDRGAVVLLDDRILTRRYGRYLRQSLPDAPLIKGPWWEVENRLRQFYRA
jgi:ATP-dependent DNA helicase DinG